MWNLYIWYKEHPRRISTDTKYQRTRELSNFHFLDTWRNIHNIYILIYYLNTLYLMAKSELWNSLNSEMSSFTIICWQSLMFNMIHEYNKLTNCFGFAFRSSLIGHKSSRNYSTGYRSFRSDTSGHWSFIHTTSRHQSSVHTYDWI